MVTWLKGCPRRRACGNLQCTKRGLRVYVLTCIFLSSSTLFVICLHLYKSLYLQDANLNKKADFYDDKSFDVVYEAFQFAGRRSKPFFPQAVAAAGVVFPDKRKLKVALPLQPTFNSAQLARSYHENTTYPRKIFDCKKLIEADKDEQQKFKSWINTRPDLLFSTVSEDIVPQMTSNCAAFKAARLYKNTTGTPEERDFPLAHVILVHKDFEHMERLVRALYRPQHSFCIHVDKKASASLRLAVAAFASCFDNIHLAPRPHAIAYAHVSRLVADIDCMEELLRRDTSWKYLVNYAATELPIRTNLETVQILSSMHGLNDIHETFSRRVVERFTRAYKLVNGRLKMTNVSLPPAPHNITVIKGQAYNSFSRAFLEWLFKDQRPRDLLIWSAKTYSPDEHFWASLNDMYHNKHLNAPGGFAGDPERKGYLTKFIIWTYENSKYPCNGRAVHHVCNFNALDLPTIVSQQHLAANKYDLNMDPVAYACMEELLENRTITPDPKFDRKRYEMLYFVRTSVKKTGNATARHSLPKRKQQRRSLL